MSDSNRQAYESQGRAAPIQAAVGAEKHITFGGSMSGGINIPGGLRAPAVSRINGSSVRRTVTSVPERPKVEPVGWDKHISFGGSTSGGINIPGGLRAPVPASRNQ